MKLIKLKNKLSVFALMTTLRSLMKDSLYGNSIYLILSTAIMAVLGFFTWILIAKFFTPHQVGLATTLISITSLIANLSLMGLNVGMIRYLPTSARKNERINTTFIIVIITSVIASLIYLAGIDIFSPKLNFVKSNFLLIALFVLFIVVFSLDLITESIFIAYRKSSYVLIKNACISILKLGLPFLLISLAFYGIFLAISLATSAALIISIVILIKKLNYKFSPQINGEIVKSMAKFSFGNYIAASLTQLPNLILPIMITNQLNPKTSAFYYVSMMIANFLYVIPSATAESLFAEGSHNEKSLKSNSIRATKIILGLATPAVLFIIIFGKFILSFFGEEYATQGYPFLVMLAVSTIFLAATRIFATILKINHKIKELIISYIISTFFILFFSYSFLQFGLIGIGYAWLLGKMILAVCLFISVIYNKHKYLKGALSSNLAKIRMNYFKI